MLTDTRIPIDGSTIIHADLKGLNSDDHEQYALTTGSNRTTLKTDSSQQGDLLSYDSTNNTWVNSSTAALEQVGNITNEPTGFINRTDSIVSFSDSSQVLIIEPVSSYDYYIHGVKHTISTTKSKSLITQGMNHFYIDSDENLQVTTSFDRDILLRNNAYIAAVYWDATSSQHIYIGDERHGITWDWNLHYYMHTTVGTRYKSGLDIVDTTAFTTIESVYNADDTLWTFSIIESNPNDFTVSAAENHTVGGTQSLSYSGSEDGDIAQFNKGEDIDLTEYNQLTGWIYITDWGGGDNIQFYGYDTQTDVVVGNSINLSDYITTATQDTWQRFNIPLADMGLSTETIDAIRMEMVGVGAPPNGYIDDLYFGNIPTVNDSDLEFGVSSGVIFDEDLDHNINKINKGESKFVVLYREGSDGRWLHDGITSVAFKNIPGGRVAWNEYSGGIWQQTEVSDNEYTIVHIFATNDTEYPIVGVQSQTTFSTLEDSRSNITNDINNIATGDMPFEEFLAVGSIIIRTSDSISNSYYASFVYLDAEHTEIWQDFRGIKGLSTGGVSITDHGNLSGLSDDDHIQYFNQTRGDSRYSKLEHDLDTHGDVEITNPQEGNLLQYDSTANQWFNTNTIDSIESITFAGGETITWNGDEYTINVDTGIGPVLQVGQETFNVIYNETGETIPNGTVVTPTGSYGIYPSVIKAKSDTHILIKNPLFVTTMDIPNNSKGIGTGAGFVRGLDTSMHTPGTVLYISDTTAGMLTSTAPSFPSYIIGVCGVTVSDSTAGVIFVELNFTYKDTFSNFYNGLIRESFDFIVTSDSTSVIGTLTPTNGHPDLTMIFSSGFYMLDTSPGKTIELTPGTDTNPQTNYIYIPHSTMQLTVSTSEWPTDVEFIKIAEVVLQSASYTETYGALVNHNWNDEIQNTNSNQGHLSHITAAIRQKIPATWKSGITPTCTVDTGSTPDDVWFSNTSGTVQQLYDHTFPAFDTETGDNIFVVNDPTTPYNSITNLNVISVDSNGNSLLGTRFSVVIWGISNKNDEPAQLMLNLPRDGYSGFFITDATVINDANNYANYTIPTQFQGVGFLITRISFEVSADGNTWTLIDTEDLRGTVPNLSAGGGSGGGTAPTDFTALLDTPNSYSGQAGKAPIVNGGETGLEFSDVLNKSSHNFVVFNSDEVITTGDGTAAFSVAAYLNGLNLTAVLATIHTQGSSGTTSVMVRRRRSGSDQNMLSTPVTVSYNEYYAADGSIDTSNDDIATGDQIYIDVDTAAVDQYGLSVVLTFS